MPNAIVAIQRQVEHLQAEIVRATHLADGSTTGRAMFHHRSRIRDRLARQALPRNPMIAGKQRDQRTVHHWRPTGPGRQPFGDRTKPPKSRTGTAQLRDPLAHAVARKGVRLGHVAQEGTKVVERKRTGHESMSPGRDHTVTSGDKPSLLALARCSSHVG
jgi:hypothetical protein